jgi:DoxX-like protein
MARTIAYWSTTGIVALMLLFSLSYLTGNEQVVTGFAKAGYPQHLRIVLGIAKPAAAVVLLVPGLALLKEWAYAGVTFAWIMAFISASASGEPIHIRIMPAVLLLLLVVSYVTRLSGRRVPSVAAPARG